MRLRQKFVYIPSAADASSRGADPDLNGTRQGPTSGEVDWEEFYAVVKARAFSKERIGRRDAWDKMAWPRAACPMREARRGEAHEQAWRLGGFFAPGRDGAPHFARPRAGRRIASVRRDTIPGGWLA